MLQKFNFNIEYSAKQVEEQIQELVNIQYYADTGLNKYSRFDDVYDYCNKQEMPKGKDENDIGEEFIKYEIEKDHEKYKEKLNRAIYEDVFQEIAGDYNSIFEKRK